MRKLMNKKGFSLVELMIVVVIMGILIAVAIPLYGAIQNNAKNKTCGNNIKAIKNNAANYYAMYDVKGTKENVASMFDGDVMPHCPWGGDAGTAYEVTINDDGSAKVECKSTDCKNKGVH